MIIAISINLITILLVIYSLTKSKEKTMKSLKIAFMKALSLGPWIIAIIFGIGLLLTFIPPETIEYYLGGDMRISQVVLAALVGTISMIPSLISLPLSGSLIDSGASYTTIAAFYTTLTMVGFITMPLEIKTLGKKVTFWRNLFAFTFAIIISIFIGILM